MADDDKKLDPTTDAPTDEVSAALDAPEAAAEAKPDEPAKELGDAVTSSVKEEGDAGKPADEAPAPEAEDKPLDGFELGQGPDKPAPQPEAPAGAQEPAGPIDEAPAEEAPAEEAKPSGLDAAVATEAEGKPEAEVEPAPVADAAGTPGASSGAPEPAEEAKPAEAKPEDKPKGPTFGDVKGEVGDLGDHLPADTLDTLRAGGCSLFLFLADMAEVDTSALSQEGAARIANVRNQTQLLLAAIESVFVRHG